MTRITRTKKSRATKKAEEPTISRSEPVLRPKVWVPLRRDSAMLPTLVKILGVQQSKVGQNYKVKDKLLHLGLTTAKKKIQHLLSLIGF